MSLSKKKRRSLNLKISMLNIFANRIDKYNSVDSDQTAPQIRLQVTCGDLASFVRGGSTLTCFFLVYVFKLMTGEKTKKVPL